MVATPSTMATLGSPAPDFSLEDPATGQWCSLADFAGHAVLVVLFLSNHCPYVKHVRRAIIDAAEDLSSSGVGFVGIMSNDVERYPDDSPGLMPEQGYPFPYLYDDDQSVAHAYAAACTPDAFVYDAQRRLVYRGQLDDARPSNDVVPTCDDVRRAVDAVLDGRPVDPDQRPSLGCNIKWKSGNEPEWF